MLPKLKRGDPLTPPERAPVPEDELPFRYDVRGIPMVTKKRAKGGFEVKVKHARISDDKLEEMLMDIAKVVMKYQIKTK